jgi:hypothetical protein
MWFFSSNYEHYLSIYITRRATKFGIYDFILGAKLTAEYGTGFRFNTLSDGIHQTGRFLIGLLQAIHHNV